MFSESQPPSIPDLVQTTLGGMAWGEGQFRIANMIFDNTKSGSERFLREAAGLVVNPMAGFNRLLRGEMWKDFQNPPDRYPGRLYTELDGAYIHNGGAAAEGTYRDQGGVSVLLRYGDPFDGDLRRPFDSFEVLLGLREPAPVLLTRLDIDGLLAEWKLSEEPASGQRLALFFAGYYLNTPPWVFGAQAFGVRHLTLVPLGRETDLRTEASVMGMPLAAFGVDYPETGMASPIGRTYDYGPGLGARASARVRRREVDLLVLSWSLIGTTTSNGISNHSRLQTLSAEARAPLTSHLLLGGAWSWSERLTTYPSLSTVRLAGTSWSLLAGWAIPESRGVPDRGNETPASPPAGPDVAGRFDLSAFAGALFGTRDGRQLGAGRSLRIRQPDGTWLCRRRGRLSVDPPLRSQPRRLEGDHAFRREHRARRALLRHSPYRAACGRPLPLARGRRAGRQFRLRARADRLQALHDGSLLDGRGDRRGDLSLLSGSPCRGLR